jgi:pimeloyl-ACP methyl ester carboxylesterase
MKSYIILIISGLIISFSCDKKTQDRMVDLGDYNLHIYDTGEGSPTVILVTGAAGALTKFNIIQKEISSITRVISYDRAGIGKSDKRPSPCTYENMVKELKLMLNKENIPPPYILVGHSMGGHLIRLFTHLYPEQVVGLVFSDASHEDFFTKVKENRTEEEWNKLDSTITDLVSGGSEIFQKEWSALINGSELLRSIKLPNDISVQVITSSKYGTTFEAFGLSPKDKLLWVDLHSKWIENKPKAKQIVTDKSGHSIYREQPELIITAIKEIINEIKKKS